MRSASIALATLGALACGGDPVPDGGPDAPAREDLSLEASPDPAERTDCAGEPPATGVARAKHVVCVEELLDGALAMGRVGDIVLENARARFVVRASSPESASTIGAHGGGLIDGSLRGGEDLLKEVFPLFDLVSMRPTTIAVVDAGGDDEARVRVLFEDAPIGLIETVLPGLGRAIQLRGAIDYVLRADEDALEIRMILTTAEGVSRSGGRMGVLALLGGVPRFEPGYGELNEDRIGAEGDAIVGERGGSAVALWLDVPGSSLTAVETIHLFRGERMSVTRGERLELRARVGVGTTAARAYAAARPSADPLLVLEGLAGDRVTIVGEDGTPAFRTRLDDGGRAAVALRAGAYDVTPGYGAYEGAPVRVTHDGGEPVPIEAAPSGTVTIAATAGGDAAALVRVTVESGGEERERFVAAGPTPHRLPPGDHRITVSRGLEHDAWTRDLSVEEGADVLLEPDLPRAMDTDGWVSVDLHLHSELSTDSVHPVETAVRMLAAEGVQAASSSDHDYVTDYAAVGARAGVDLTLVAGVEVSTTVYGHINGYPLSPDPARAGAGAPVWFDLAPTEVFDALRAQGDADRGGALVQINHPRFDSAAFFDAVGLDRETGRAAGDPTALDLPAETDLDDFGFEVLEVFNGCCRTNDDEVLEDYLALWAAGRRFTMVGNSDSHDAERPPGSPRSFVRVPDEAAFGWADVAAGLRSGEVTVAGGIFVTASLEGPVAGDTAPLRVRVQAPPWATTDRMRIWAGRTLVVDRAVPPDGDPRLDELVDVPLGGAEFLLVRVDGPVAADPIQHFAPYGVTNPILVAR